MAALALILALAIAALVLVFLGKTEGFQAEADQFPQPLNSET